MLRNYAIILHPASQPPSLKYTSVTLLTAGHHIHAYWSLYYHSGRLPRNLQDGYQGSEEEKCHTIVPLGHIYSRLNGKPERGTVHITTFGLTGMTDTGPPRSLVKGDESGRSRGKAAEC
ncbi:hypothetical protein EYF80_045610 [Liparis tanakae]|uniref:Uncharacterized protein n=1 Tax=Liparis tanakae TaxID=230148 RepID=A0A4Z2FTU0_9TELE|nr:hypothetical protein EYF80_045610 [Liparis tanakae]